MREIFQSYEHYLTWMLNNWGITKEMNDKIIDAGLSISNDWPYEERTFLTKTEFAKKESKGFIFVPTV